VNSRLIWSDRNSSVLFRTAFPFLTLELRVQKEFSNGLVTKSHNGPVDFCPEKPASGNFWGYEWGLH
jgi:hypothetical protein